MADEAVLDATPVDSTPVDAAPVDTAVPDAPVDATHPDGTTPAVDPNEAMWGDLKDEPATDPNAAPVIPEEYSKALSISEYVKEPAHLEQAVRAAQEMWDVQTGKVPATALFEGMRQSNPQQYEKMMLEQVIPYVEQITGKKLGETAPVDPNSPEALRAELERIKQQPLIEAQQRERQAYVSRAEEAGGKHIETLIKSGNGIFDGDVQAAVQAVGAQFAKLGVSPDDVMKQVMSGNMTTLEKAYKAAERAETLKAKAYSDRIRARYQSLKNSVPKTGTSTAPAPGSDKPDLTTASGRAKAMAVAFAAGRDTI